MESVSVSMIIIKIPFKKPWRTGAVWTVGTVGHQLSSSQKVVEGLPLKESHTWFYPHRLTLTDKGLSVAALHGEWRMRTQLPSEKQTNHQAPHTAGIQVVQIQILLLSWKQSDGTVFNHINISPVSPVICLYILLCLKVTPLCTYSAKTKSRLAAISICQVI